MKYPLAGVCSRDIQCETGHLRYSILKKQNSHTLPRTSGQLHFSMSHFKCQFLLKKNRKKLKKVVDKPFKGWYYSQCRRKQDRHNKNNSETIMRIVAITKTIQNH